MEASGTCVFSAQGTAARYTAEAVIPQGEGRLDELINADRDKSSQSARSPESGESPPSGMQTPSSDGSSADISILSLPKASMPCESRRMSEVGQSSMVSSADVSLEVAFSRVQELGRENLELKDTIRGNNTAIRLAHDQLMLMRSAWERDRDEVRAKNEEARVVVMELKTECDQKDLRIKALEKELDQVKSLERDGEADSTASMQEEVRHLLVDLEREKLERQHLSNENAALRSDAEDLRGRCSKANQEVLQTRQRRTELESRVNDLQDQLTKLTSIKSSLAQEKNELVAINNSLQSQLHVYKMASPTGSLDHSSVDGMDEDEAAAGFVQVNLLKSAPGGDFGAAGSGRTASGSDVIATETEEEERADTLRAAEGASTPRTSRENIKVKHEGAVSDLLIQLRVEREEKMQVENARRQSDLLVEQLRSDLRQNEAELVEAQSKLSGLIRSHKEREDDLTRQMALLQKNIRSQDQQHAEEELQNTRAQVLSLVNELQEANTKATAAKKEADSLHEKNQQLEERLNRIHKEKDDQRNRDDQLISTLGASVRDLEGVVASDRQKLEEYRTKMDRVVSQARQLTSKNEEYRKQLEETKIAQTNRGVGPAQMRDLQETVDSYMAKLMGAEDTARGKDDEIQQLKLKIQQIKSDVETVPVLQAQADLYKMDFEAEHHARVRSETEKSKLLEEMDLLRATIQQLQEQIGNLTSHPLAELQRRHVDTSLGGPGTRQPNHQVVHQDMTYATYPRNRRDYYGEHDETDLHEMSQPCCCPRCNEVFPDLDSLHVHLAECVR
nr:inhibitor of nuclear factor kappa-B kinase subunit gamma-like protein [Arenicola marina]